MAYQISKLLALGLASCHHLKPLGCAVLEAWKEFQHAGLPRTFMLTKAAGEETKKLSCKLRRETKTKPPCEFLKRKRHRQRGAAPRGKGRGRIFRGRSTSRHRLQLRDTTWYHRSVRTIQWRIIS